VHVAHRRRTGAEVEELRDAPAGKVLDPTAQEIPADPGDRLDHRERLHGARSELAVDRPVRVAPEEPVVDPGGVRALQVNAFGNERGNFSV
jgi:hypothetical protein